MATAVAAKTLTVLKKSIGKQLAILTKNAQLEGSKQDFRNQRSYEHLL